MSELSFTVYGTPIPQGSMKAFMPRGFHRPIITSDNTKLKPWRNDVKCAALNEMEENKFTLCGRNVPMLVEVTFFFPRPKSSKEVHKTTKPDADKLLRALLDALTGIVFEDDSQVVDVILKKRFDAPGRAEVVVREIETFPLFMPPGKPARYRPIKDKDTPF